MSGKALTGVRYPFMVAQAEEYGASGLWIWGIGYRVVGNRGCGYGARVACYGISASIWFR
ncbi:hypothetical protein BLAT2472_20024 [Burkholderia latens]